MILTEGGLRNVRIEYVEEETQGITPTDPAWQIASDRYTSFEPDSFGPAIIEHDVMGQADPDLQTGLEDPSVTVGYHMQQWFNDTNGDPQDLAAYGMSRDASNLPEGSVTIVERMRSGDVGEGIHIRPKSTVEYRYNGTEDATPRESRVYTVARGALVNEPSINSNPEDQVWEIENTIPCESGRSFQIDQPVSGGASLHVESTDASDTDLDIVVESDGPSPTSETITTDSTDATTTTSGATTFESIDAIEVQDGSGDTADHDGDILVYEDDGGTAGELLTVLYGRSFYGNTYGDRGVPLLGAGSHASDIGTSFYNPGNLSVLRGGSPFEAVGEFQGTEVSVSNDTTATPAGSSREQRRHAGGRSTEATITYDGETISHTALVERMAGTQEDLVLGFDPNDAETLTLHQTMVSEAPRSRSAGENATENDITFMAAHPGLSISNASP